MPRSLKWIILATCIAAGLLSYAFLRPHKVWHDPVSIEFNLAGNFGELRSNHFHMGLDVRTNGEEDLPVYAVENGYVSRVLMEEYSLGKAVFITHPNGQTSVYAHLNRFYDQLQTAVEAKQYATHQPQQDIAFPAGAYPVERGQFIARSGNTGGSEAPHLHFELRDTKSGNNLNPLLYGFSMNDDTPPILAGLYWYNRQYSTYSMPGNSITLAGKEGQYHPARSIIKVRSPRISFGIRAIDKSNDDRFRFGIYKTSLVVDGKQYFESIFNDFSNDDSRYINASIDYPKWKKTGQFIQHLSVLPGNHFPASEGAGIIDLSDGAVHHVSIRLYDANNNTTVMEGNIQYSGAVEKPASVAAAQRLVPDRPGTVEGKYTTVRFSEKAFYDTVLFQLKEQPTDRPGKVSPLISLHNASVPVHEPYTVSIKASTNLTDAQRKKVVLQLNDGRESTTVKGAWQGNAMTARLSSLGTVQLLLDTAPPSVRLARGQQELDNTRSNDIKLTCKDDTGPIDSFRAELDGKWVLYDKKGEEITLHLPRCAPGRHQLKITLSDVAGNVASQTYSFNRR